MLQACHSSFQVNCGMILCLLTLSQYHCQYQLHLQLEKEVKKAEMEEDSKKDSEKLYCSSILDLKDSNQYGKKNIK